MLFFIPFSIFVVIFFSFSSSSSSFHPSHWIGVVLFSPYTWPKTWTKLRTRAEREKKRNNERKGIVQCSFFMCLHTFQYFEPNKIIYGISFAGLRAISLFTFKLFRSALSTLGHTNHRCVSCFYRIAKSVQNMNELTNERTKKIDAFSFGRIFICHFVGQVKTPKNHTQTHRTMLSLIAKYVFVVRVVNWTKVVCVCESENSKSSNL